MKVKICGLTNNEDATWAINYGADYLGINFYRESPRYVSIDAAAKWVPALPSFAVPIGVFVDAEEKYVASAVAKARLKGIQLHGSETPEQITALKKLLEEQGHPVFVMKGFRLKDESVLETLPSFLEAADYFLLDSFVDGQIGGTGTVFNWDLAVKAKEIGKPVFLAGGLTPENVGEAVKKVSPFAVDVASGVERSPRRKDSSKIQAFINNSKRS